MTKLSLTILISLVATLLTSSPAFGAKEIYERTKPHVNVGAHSGYRAPEYQSPLSQEAYFKSASAQQNVTVQLNMGFTDDDAQPLYPGTKAGYMSRQVSRVPINGLWVDSDSDGYGNYMGNTGGTVIPAYIENTKVLHEYASKIKPINEDGNPMRVSGSEQQHDDGREEILILFKEQR